MQESRYDVTEHDAEVLKKWASFVPFDGSSLICDRRTCPAYQEGQICSSGMIEKAVLSWGPGFWGKCPYFYGQVESTNRIAQSGLSELLSSCTFDSFQTAKPYQREMAKTAAAYVDAVGKGAKPWFFIGGQSGCGKTHICTAICGKLLDAGIQVKYARWLPEARALKAKAMDGDAFKAAMQPFAEASVLYLDDLLKTTQGAAPTPADVSIALEIISQRELAQKPTIISTEWTLNDLLSFDQSAFSRVHALSKGYMLIISRDQEKNYRLRV